MREHKYIHVIVCARINIYMLSVYAVAVLFLKQPSTCYFALFAILMLMLSSSVVQPLCMCMVMDEFDDIVP